ncbi:MAG: RNA-guided endonuclease InsQ/TnpB family protein [Halorhodospira sp.]
MGNGLDGIAVWLATGLGLAKGGTSGELVIALLSLPLAYSLLRCSRRTQVLFITTLVVLALCSARSPPSTSPRRTAAERAKARRHLARCHAKVADTRADWLHQQTTRIVRENQAIYIEDLAVQGLARSRLAKSVQDAAWGQFRRLLEEKAHRWARTLVASAASSRPSQVCSACGRHDGAKPLAVRTWTCTGCGTRHDRDTNAARNILALGRRERLNACGADVSPSLGMAVGGEAGTHQPAPT